MKIKRSLPKVEFNPLGGCYGTCSTFPLVRFPVVF